MERVRQPQILRMRQVVDLVGFAPSTIYDLVAKGKFPPPFKLVKGGRASGWLLQTIEDWMLDRSRGVNNED